MDGKPFNGFTLATSSTIVSSTTSYLFGYKWTCLKFPINGHIWVYTWHHMHVKVPAVRERTAVPGRNLRYRIDWFGNDNLVDFSGTRCLRSSLKPISLSAIWWNLTRSRLWLVCKLPSKPSKSCCLGSEAAFASTARVLLWYFHFFATRWDAGRLRQTVSSA